MAVLTYKIDGVDGFADFADLAEFSAALTEALRVIHRVEHPGYGPLPRYRVQRLEVGSALVGLGGEIEAAKAIVNLVRSVEQIRNRQRPDLSLDGPAVRALRKLSDPLESSTASIVLNDVPIDSQFRSGCNWLLDNAPKSFGQAIGRLEGLNVHHQNFFRLYPEGQDRGAECYFSESLYGDVYSATKRRVRVEGLIQRDPDGVGVDRITKISRLEILPESDQLPSFESLFGLWKDAPIDAQELRGGWD